MNEVAQKLEALLFTAGEPLKRSELCELLQVAPEELARAADELREALAGHGLTVVMTAQHIQLMTSPAVASFVEQFLDTEDEPLSKASAEVLALVAYRGPIARFDIEAIRGVDSTRTLRQLVWRGLLTKQKAKGRSILYDVSEEFFAHVGIARREDLPHFDSLQNNEALRHILNQTHP